MVTKGGTDDLLEMGIGVVILAKTRVTRWVDEMPDLWHFARLNPA